MQNHLTDLDELLEGVRKERSRKYISEAIRCYRAGAYRSAIIATWIAVCTDIIDKIKELNSEGDNNTTELINKLKTLTANDVKGTLEYEKALLESAENSLKIISHNESILLQRIKEDRNICAHPDFQIDGQNEPITPEGARAHIVNACNALLLRAPIRGKVLIEQIQNLLDRGFIPPDEEGAFAVLSSEEYLGRAQESVFKELINNFLEQIFQEGNRILHSKEKSIHSALKCMSKLKPDLCRETLNKKLNPLLLNIEEERLKRIFLLPFLWSTIKDSTKPAITGLTSKLSADDIIDYQLHFFSETALEFKPILTARVAEFDINERLKIVAGTPAKGFKDQAIQTFIDSHSFAGACENGQIYLLPHAQYFDGEDLRKVMQGSLENSRWGINQILNAGGMDEVFINLFHETKKIPECTEIWSEFWRNAVSHYARNLRALSELLAAERVI